ncbi:hypothetical protein AGMMS50212_08190 [Spirochaetia bacterium]|nr:hypothetical protein AGMMS50212_08190 [Spirochaetia bacterium]
MTYFIKRLLCIKSIALLSLLAVGGVMAQTEPQPPVQDVVLSSPLKAMSFSGATGLFAIPTGRIGWEHAANFGIDIGAAYDVTQKEPYVKLAMSFVKWFEVSAIVGVPHITSSDAFANNLDTVIGAKFHFPLTRSALAVGGNLHLHREKIYHDDIRLAGQAYIAATYLGYFFGMSAETSFAVGYTFNTEYTPGLNIGLGFDIELAPNLFRHALHWIMDFSNFSYNNNHENTKNEFPGCLNTGLRVDLSVIPVLNKFKASIDLTGTNLLYKERSFVVSLLFGIPVVGN